MSVGKTPLESWIASRIGGKSDVLTREQISRYQLRMLQETIREAYDHSPFYRERLQGVAEVEITSTTDLRRFPFTTAEDIRQYGLKFLCVSQSEINRVVTLDSSGTTGQAKRIYFTSVDQQSTLDFFQYGIASFTVTSDRVLILLPGERPGSVGDQLSTAVIRLGAKPILWGTVNNIQEVLQAMKQEAVNCLVGSPSDALALARYGAKVGKQLRLKSVLLSTDHVPDAIVNELKRLWGCEVFEHYGMTELGFGGGTECLCHNGYHLHEADFYFEVIDPLTGITMPDGQEGEVVVTTLSRRGMPLIRYRTGDISMLWTEPCGCGALLRRLSRITKRTSGYVMLSNNLHFTMADLNECLFKVERVINFKAAVNSIRKATALIITALVVGQAEGICGQIYMALDEVPAICQARGAGKLMILVKVESCDGTMLSSTGKRVITEWSKVVEEPNHIFNSPW